MLSKLYRIKNIINTIIITYLVCYSPNIYPIAYLPGGKDFISNRLILNENEYGQEYSTQNALHGIGIFFDGLINIATRNNKPDLTGYNVTTTGLYFGGDYLVNEEFIVGAALTYANSNVRTSTTISGAPRDANKVRTYNGVLFFSFMPRQTFIDVYLTAGRNQYNITRNIRNTGEQATAKSNAKQHGIRGVIGHNILGHFDSSSSFAPVFSLNYVSLDGYTYTESGTLANNQTVTKPNTRKMEVGIGVEASSEFKGAYSRFIPQMHFMILRDFSDKRHNSLASFTLAEGAFKSLEASPKRITYNLGLAFTISSSERLFVTGAYDFALQSRYKSHTATFILKYIF
jgi:uncharacterized protein with beta-barrel porin domain